jgi:hypothetical protein
VTADDFARWRPYTASLQERPVSDSEPTTHDLIVELRDALGLFSGAMPISPKQAWEEAIDTVTELTHGRCWVCMTKEDR